MLVLRILPLVSLSFSFVLSLSFSLFLSLSFFLSHVRTNTISYAQAWFAFDQFTCAHI